MKYYFRWNEVTVANISVSSSTCARPFVDHDPVDLNLYT